MLSSPISARPVVDLDSLVLKIGPLNLHVDGCDVTTGPDDQPALGLPFKSGFFLAACGYRTWDLLTNLGVRVNTGWTRIAGNGIEYGCWVEVDEDTARVLARLAHQELLISWTPTSLRISSGDADGPVLDIDLHGTHASPEFCDVAKAGGSG